MKSPATRVKLRTDIGPGGVVYLVIAGLILAASYYTQAPLLFWAFGLMIGGVLVSMVLSWQMLRKIEVQRLMPSHGVVGQMTVLRYRLVNRGMFPVFGMMVSETWGKGFRGWRRFGPMYDDPARLKGRPHGWVMHLGPHQTAQAEAPCWPCHRGHMRFERIMLSTSFPFGVLRRVMVVDQINTVLVYPRLYRMDRGMVNRLSTIDPLGRKRLEKGGGNEEFFGLRPYREGDSMKLIDWKQTAKRSNLVTREMTQPCPPRVMLAVDMRFLWDGSEEPASVTTGLRKPSRKEKKIRQKQLETKHEQAELVISLASSVICDAYLRGFQIGLLVLGVPSAVFPMHHSLPHRMRMLESLSMLDVTQRRDDIPGLTEEPTVMVRPGADNMHARPMIIGTDHLLATKPALIEPGQLLQRQPKVASRREELGETA